MPQKFYEFYRNDERVERLYFLRKQNEAKTFIRIRATRFFILFWILRYAQYDDVGQIRA